MNYRELKKQATQEPLTVEGDGWGARVFAKGLLADVTGDEKTRPANARLIAHCVNNFDKALDALKLHHSVFSEMMKHLPKVSVQINGEHHAVRLGRLIAELEEVK